MVLCPPYRDIGPGSRGGLRPLSVPPSWARRTQFGEAPVDLALGQPATPNHDAGNLGGVRDVLQRVGVQQDDVGPFASFNRAGAIERAEVNRDVARNGERAVNDLLLRRVLYGISCRNYEAAAEAIPGAIGLSGSTVSRAFIQASATKLRELQERDLSGEDVVALVLDGKTFAEATMVVALGITMTGDKRFLGFVETDTENEQVVTPFLRSLVERGLEVSQGLLVIVDGGKGLRAAVRKAFRHRALVQRCQWHASARTW